MEVVMKRAFLFNNTDNIELEIEKDLMEFYKLKLENKLGDLNPFFHSHQKNKCFFSRP